MVALLRLDWRRRSRNQPQFEHIIIAAPAKQAAEATAHHGSHTSSTQAFLQAVQPRWAVVSVGADNSFGHPHPEVLQRLQDIGAGLLRTDRMGAIVFRTDGQRMRVEKFVEKE